MRKTVPFAVKPNAKTPVEDPEGWVRSGREETQDEPPAPPEPMKRLTIDIPARLHTRVKSQCAERGVKMADEMRRLLDEAFPE